MKIYYLWLVWNGYAAESQTDDRLFQLIDLENNILLLLYNYFIFVLISQQIWKIM